MLLIGLGFLFLAFAAVGLLLPVWPTTPFVLLCAACFSCSPGLRAKILRVRFIREYDAAYRAGQGLTRRTVWSSLAYLWGMLLLSMALGQKPWLTLALTLVGAAVTLHILWMARGKRKKRNEGKSNPAARP